VAHPRTILALTTAIALAGGLASPAYAGPDKVDREAASILSNATTRGPLTVVTTTETADGPEFSTKTADSKAEALDVISTALDAPGTAAVDLAHPVSIAGKRVRRANDTFRGAQWGLNKLQAEKAWRKTKGKGVMVAVIDTGVRAYHPDLKGRVLKGVDFVGRDYNAGDANGHGTHVAGIIAATANNRRGVAGLAPKAKILPVRVLDGNGNGNTAMVAAGIVYATRRGADVINLSLAGVTADAQTQAAIRYAIRKGVVVLAAAGNAGCGAPTTYPAAYPNVIGVGAIDRNGNVAPYSNCGSYVDVVAPGSNIISTTTYRPSPTLGCGYGVSYCRLDGTSMATPYASASAALLIARSKRHLRPSQVRRIMTKRATDIGPRGRDAMSGYGLVNPRKMLAGR
jgi:type VII secretion-associated serine protease mycosin